MHTFPSIGVELSTRRPFFLPLKMLFQIGKPPTAGNFRRPSFSFPVFLRTFSAANDRGPGAPATSNPAPLPPATAPAPPVTSAAPLPLPAPPAPLPPPTNNNNNNFFPSPVDNSGELDLDFDNEIDTGSVESTAVAPVAPPNRPFRPFFTFNRRPAVGRPTVTRPSRRPNRRPNIFTLPDFMGMFSGRPIRFFTFRG